MAGNKVGSKSAAEALVIKTPPILVTSVTLDKTKETIKENETITLKATVTPDDATFRNVHWSCSDTSVAKLSATTSVSGTNITITGNSGGKATITATATDGSGKSASFTIIVDGGYVNYPIDLGIASSGNTLVNGGKPQTDWRVFYQDDKYTYIIAADYIPVSKFPAGVFPANNGKYNGWWPSAPIGTIISWDYKDRFLFNGLTTVNSSNANYKAVSYLLNTDLWTSIVDSTYADVAIGSPTLEMLCASWNASTPNEPLYFGVNNTGYTVGKSVDSLVANNLSTAEYKGSDNTIYFPHNNSESTAFWEGTPGYWLASPGSVSSMSICVMNFECKAGGTQTYTGYNSRGYGIRPVVCLKSNVDLVLDDEGIWQLHTISLDKNEDQEKFIGNTFEVTPTVYPADAENKNVKWTSSNPSVAIVSTGTTESGTPVLIKCISEGEAIITATLDSNSKCSQSFKVTVSDTYVNYPVDLGLTTAEHTLVDGTIPKTDWRIFYQDGTYTYLIAADYIPTSKFPAGVFTGTYGKHNGYWPSTPSGTTPTWEYKDRFLFSNLSSVNSSNANYKATTYLLNTDLWETMLDGTYADVAIGGPTLEMMCVSWNEGYPTQKLKFGVNSTGYTVGKTNNNLGYRISVSDYWGSYNTLYFPHSTPELTQYMWNGCCYGYWLASPSSRDTISLMQMHHVSSVDSGKSNNYEGSGIRPVVMLKSTTKLTKDSNGIWQLSN